ncbi:hypothetical protein BC936DRAFT_140685 [Jimgerdemannia flammicorona]|uniref:Uncharacterized protein n=1 Tax=Jimgerdemannia flammicorona TaxID=994334 RepID=A0A433AEH5_9FUNG|nr:hypothetical protein BC936DRAFT_140685 [Jimgerdemannia flammicorona]
MSNSPADDDDVDDFLYGSTSGESQPVPGGVNAVGSTRRGDVEKDIQAETVDDDDELYDLYGDNIENEDTSNIKARPTPEAVTSSDDSVRREVNATATPDQKHHDEDQDEGNAENDGIADEGGGEEGEEEEEEEEEEEDSEDVCTLFFFLLLYNF